MSDQNVTDLDAFDDASVIGVSTSIDELFIDDTFDTAASERVAARDVVEQVELFTPAEKAKNAKKAKQRDSATAQLANGEIAQKMLETVRSAAKKTKTTGEVKVKPAPRAAVKVKVTKLAQETPTITKKEQAKLDREALSAKKALDKEEAKAVRERAKEAKAAKAAERESKKVVAPIDYVLPKKYQPDSWAEAVAMGEAFVDQQSSSQMQLGWLAMGIPSEYGKETIKQYARAIGISASGLNAMRWVASGFSPDDVAKFPNLTYSHFKAVAGVIFSQGKEAAMDALEWAMGDGSTAPASIEMLNKHIRGEKEPTAKTTLVVPGGHFFIVNSVEEFAAIFEAGRTYTGVSTTDAGNWREEATEAGLNNGGVKATYKSLVDE